MQHYYDNVTRITGVASEGERVFVMQNGSLATIYSDNGITQAPNPLATNANGGFDFYAPDGTYTWMVQAIGGTEVHASALLFDASQSASSLATNLAAPSGSSLVGFTQSGTGAVARTVQDKGREWVSVKDFGAKGDGVTDDTAAIQAALNSGAIDVSGAQAATYIINSTISVPSGVTLRDITVKAGGSKTGTLDSLGIHVQMSGAAKSACRRIKLKPSSTSFTLNGTDYKRAISIDTGSTYCEISDCDIDVTGISLDAALGVYSGSDYSRITGNTVTASGVHYTTGGSRFTVCARNTIISSTVDALSGLGDTVSRDAFGCVVEANTIVSPARMGIEDYCVIASSKYLRGTRIVDNTIYATGSATYYAISAVSPYAVIQGNTIRNWQVTSGYAIEVGQNLGITVANNKIYWTDGNPSSVLGIQQNPTNAILGANIFSGNFISGASTAFQTHQTTNTTQTVYTGNVIEGCGRACNNDTAAAKMEFIGNTVRVTTANTAGRAQVTIGSDSVVNGNRIIYDAAASGGTGTEMGLYVIGSNVTVAQNIVDGGNITANGAAPVAFTANGSTGSNVKFLFNQALNGATVSYQSFTALMTLGNSVSGAILSAGLSEMSFFDQQTLAAKPTVTGSRGGNAALASLLTDLAGLGLLTDSSSA